MIYYNLIWFRTDIRENLINLYDLPYLLFLLRLNQ